MMFQKTYMSRAVTRAMAIDHPIGDPTGGVAFGERNDPISAAISIATMFSTAQAGFAAMTVMQGIAFAGAAVSLVGNVTGNKTLMQLGAVAGIIGGLGSVGAFGEAAKGATFGAGTSTGAAVPLGSTPSAAPAPSTTPWGGTVTSAPPASMPGVALEGVPSAAGLQLSPLNAPSPGPAALPSLAETNANIINALPGAAAAPSSATASLGSATAPIMDYAAGGATAALPAGGTPFTSSLVSGGGTNVLPVGEASMYDTALGYGKKALGFVKENPTAAAMAGRTVGAVGDWLTGKTDAELEALKAQSSLYGARGDQIKYEIELEKQKRANLNAGYTNVNAGIRVNPNAGITQPWSQQGPGLINAARTTG